MKAYFTASIHGKKDYEDNYQKIVDLLVKLGYKVESGHIFNVDLEDFSEQTDDDRINYYKKMVKSITAADLLVAELSYSSASVGHEITLALEKGKPVIALYSRGKGSHLLTGISSEKLQVIDYDLESLESLLKDAIEDAKDQMDVRFNFFISPKIGAYLDWIAKNKKLPRAVFLRRLIEEHMKKNTSYKA